MSNHCKCTDDYMFPILINDEWGNVCLKLNINFILLIGLQEYLDLEQRL